MKQENNQDQKWISAEIKPEYNLGVLVFIPEEDFHITSGMWDISNEWVLLDEYRKPECVVTHWMPMPDIPKEYKKKRNEMYSTMALIRKFLPPKF